MMTIISIYYNYMDNMFFDENGNIIYDIFRIITPNQLLLFKDKQGTFYIDNGDPDTRYEFVFPLEEDDDE